MPRLRIVSIITLCAFCAEAANQPRALTLRDALALALKESPELAPYSYEERAAEARILQAGLRPNPEASLRYEKFTGEQETTLEFSQLLELGGKRVARIRSAQAGMALARYDYEAKRLEVLSDTTQLFFAVLGAQRKVELTGEVVKLAEEIAPEIQKRIESGKASSLEQIRNDVAVASARIGLEQANYDLAAARRKLASKWGSRRADFEHATGDLDRIAEPAAFGAYVSRISSNPSLARWSAETEKRMAVVQKEKADAKPNVTVSAGPRWLAGPDALAFVAGVSIPLPIQNQNQGNIREAEALVEKATAERRAAEAQLIAEAGDAYEQMAKAYSEIQILTSAVLPNAQKAMAAVKESFGR